MTTATRWSPVRRLAFAFNLESGDKPRPAQDGRTIQLPNSLTQEDLIPVLNGSSYVFAMPDSAGQYFVGHDGNNLFVALLQKHYNLRRLATYPKAEEQFLESLRPSKLNRYAKRYGLKLHRQGDLWFARLAQEAPDINQWFSYWNKSGFGKYHHQEVVGQALLKTHHRLTGIIHTPRRERGCELCGEPAVILTGTVTAPDHYPVTFDIPHIAQRSDAFIY